MIPIPPTALGHLGDHEPQPVISSTRHPPPTPASHLAPNRPRAHREPGDAPPAFPSHSRKPAIECIQCMHCMHFPQPKMAHTSSFARKHTPGTHPFTPVSPGNSTKTAQFPLFSPLLNCSIGARPAPYASTAWAGTPRPSQNQAPRSHSRSTITASKNPSASNPSFTSSLIHLFTHSLLPSPLADYLSAMEHNRYMGPRLTSSFPPERRRRPTPPTHFLLFRFNLQFQTA